MHNTYWIVAARLVLAAGSILASQTHLPAAPPDLKYLYPAGAQQGQTVELTAAGSFAQWPVQTWVDRPGVAVTPAADKGKLTVTVAADAMPGLYWMRLHDREGASPPCPLIIGSLPEVLEEEPNDHFRKPHRLAFPAATVNGRLRGRRGEEVDTYAVELTKDQTLVASLEANSTLASPVDAIMQIVSAEGFVLEENEDLRGLDPQIVFRAPADGTYLVRLFGFPATPTSRIDFAGDEAFVYRLTLTTAGWIDYTLPLAIERGRPSTVAVHGWNLPADATTLTVEPLDETISAAAIDARLSSAATLFAEPHPVATETEPNDHQHPQPIELPRTITGRIDAPQDQDVYSFAAKQGQTLQFRLLSRALGYPLDAVLELTDAAGKSLERVDDAGGDRDAELTHRVREDGDFRLIVSDLHRNGGPRFVYLLHAVVAEPDFALTVDNHAFTVSPGKPLEIPVKIERRIDFAGEIELKVLGLPPGVSAPPVKSLAKDASAKSAKLTVAAETGEYSGPVRIIGEAAGEKPITHTAESTLRGRPQRTIDLWLTIQAPTK
ncbi:MAG: PPC domain-containing protein [Planctomycetes bacterium]|nr:PPC domain-containing protein [Planctomycetota bacterium]